MEMKIVGSGVNSDVELQVDPSHKASRVSLRPVEVGFFGSYAIGLRSGQMSAGLVAGSIVGAFKWSGAGILCRVTRVGFQMCVGGTGFAIGNVGIDLVRATSLSAQYTGGQTLSLQGKDQARATRFAGSQQGISNSAVGNIAIANTGALTAGTPAPVLDTNPMHTLLLPAPSGGQTSVGAPPSYLIDPTEAARQPLELVNGEGFVVKATVPATGTWFFGLNIDWDEVDQQRYLGMIT